MGPQAWEKTDSLPSNIRGPSGELLSAWRGRWRTLPSWLTRSTHRLGGVWAYSLPVATSNEARLLAHEGLQQQPSTGTQQGGVSTPVATMMRPTANSPPVGRERRTTAPAGMNRERGRLSRALGGLQQQEWTGDQQEGVQLQPTATMHSAVVLPPVGRGRRTATPAWMSTRMGDTALVPGEL